MFEKMTIEKYCEILGDKAPAPGGGSALAVVGAEACSLIEMSIAVTAEKLPRDDEKYIYLQDELFSLKRAKTHLFKLGNDDAEAYENIVRARKLPKATEEETKNRTSALQKAFHKATLVPLSVMGLCMDVIKRSSLRVLPNVSKYVISDCEIGISLLKTATEFSVKNVYANTCFIHDVTLKNTLEKQAEDILNQLKQY